MNMNTNEAYITGVGQSEVGIRVTRHPLLLTVDAVKEALNEAGLTIGQIDGVSTYPGRMSGLLGFSPIGADELIDRIEVGDKARGHGPGAERLVLGHGDARQAQEQGIPRDPGGQLYHRDRTALR